MEVEKTPKTKQHGSGKNTNNKTTWKYTTMLPHLVENLCATPSASIQE